MAGLESEKRAEFVQSLETFCKKYGFDYSRPELLATLTASILNNKNAVPAELSAFTRTANKAPENMYAELMGHVAAVNGPSMIQFEPTLKDLIINGETAKALATTQDGRRVPVPFRRLSGGWLLAEP